MPLLNELLHQAGRDLGSAAEARLLLAHACGQQVTGILARMVVSPDEAIRFAELVSRRRDGEPVQYLTGEAAFRTITVSVGPGVFIPRPETEVMTGWALDRLREMAESGLVPRVVELCAGSGAISAAIAAELPGCDQYAVELSAEALDFAERNLADTGVALVAGDMAEALPWLDGSVDVVLANPPYIPLAEFEAVAVDVREHEPALALFSGADGLDALRVVARVASRLLRPGGLVCAEHADSQGEAAVELFVEPSAFTRVRDNRDLTGRPRFITAIRADRPAGRMRA